MPRDVIAPRERQDVTPKMRPAWLAITVAFGAAVLVVLLVLLFLTWLIGVPLHASRGTNPVAGDRSDLIEAVKTSLAVAAGLGAVVAIVLNYRRHRIEESQSHRDDQRLFSDRFQSAAEQLGHERPAVRLAGVHSMARLADDWDEQRQTCIDVLCAYLRLPPGTGTEDQPTTPREEGVVRQTIVRLITDHLRVDPTAISWHGHNLDFTGAVFDGGTFSFIGANFDGGEISFAEATFSGGVVDFSNAEFASSVDFRGATFSGASVHFFRARFLGGRINFNDATFSSGVVRFTFSVFAGGTLDFYGAMFSGSRVAFHYAEFTGGKVDFRRVATWASPPRFDFSDSEIPQGVALPAEGQDDLTPP